jgi:hypothetical protein
VAPRPTPKFGRAGDQSRESRQPWIFAVPDDIQIAYERARRLFGAMIWKLLTSHEQADAIYKELRALDAERIVAQVADSHDS